jgi:hypothetical protein
VYLYFFSFFDDFASGFAVVELLGEFPEIFKSESSSKFVITSMDNDGSPFLVIFISGGILLGGGDIRGDRSRLPSEDSKEYRRFFGVVGDFSSLDTRGRLAVVGVDTWSG